MLFKDPVVDKLDDVNAWYVPLDAPVLFSVVGEGPAKFEVEPIREEKDDVAFEPIIIEVDIPKEGEFDDEPTFKVLTKSGLVLDEASPDKPKHETRKMKVKGPDATLYDIVVPIDVPSGELYNIIEDVVDVFPDTLLLDGQAVPANKPLNECDLQDDSVLAIPKPKVCVELLQNLGFHIFLCRVKK